MDEIWWKLEQKEIQLIMSGWIISAFLFFFFFFLHTHLLMEPLVKGLITACDAITSWNLSTIENFHVEGVSSQNKKRRYLAKLENRKSRLKTPTNQKYSQRLSRRCLPNSASKLFRTDVLPLKLCWEMSFIQQLWHSKPTAFSKRRFAT